MHALIVLTIGSGIVAHANDDENAEPAQTVSVISNDVQFYPDAQREADKWVVDYPKRVAVSVFIGASEETSKLPQTISNIESAMRYQLSLRGHDDVKIYFEQGKGPATGVMLHSDIVVKGPFFFGRPEELVQGLDEFSLEMNVDPVAEKSDLPLNSVPH